MIQSRARALMVMAARHPQNWISNGWCRNLDQTFFKNLENGVTKLASAFFEIFSISCIEALNITKRSDKIISVISLIQAQSIAKFGEHPKTIPFRKILDATSALANLAFILSAANCLRQPEEPADEGANQLIMKIVQRSKAILQIFPSLLMRLKKKHSDLVLALEQSAAFLRNDDLAFLQPIKTLGSAGAVARLIGFDNSALGYMYLLKMLESEHRLGMIQGKPVSFDSVFWLFENLEDSEIEAMSPALLTSYLSQLHKGASLSAELQEKWKELPLENLLQDDRFVQAMWRENWFPDRRLQLELQLNDKRVQTAKANGQATLQEWAQKYNVKMVMTAESAISIIQECNNILRAVGKSNGLKRGLLMEISNFVQDNAESDPAIIKKLHDVWNEFKNSLGWTSNPTVEQINEIECQLEIL